MEERLSDLQNQNNSCDLSKDVNWKAVRLMQDWYNAHEHYPYPSIKEVKELSKKGNIATNDVETWFQFERIRRSAVPK